MDNVSKYPVKYSVVSIILYLIGLEISNLLKEIKNRSPNVTKQLPADIKIPTSEQIEEARKDFTGFVKNAISVAAKRQEAMNLIDVQLNRVKELVIQVEGILSLMIQNPSPISKEEFGRVNQARTVLKEREDTVVSIEKKLREFANTINELLAKHADEWQQHYRTYVDKLIVELEAKQILLSELEKQELIKPTKTIEEVKYKLKKAGIIK